jgi:hypothetical protein
MIPKQDIFELEIVLFIFLKDQLHKFQDYFTIFSSLPSVPGALVNIFHNKKNTKKILYLSLN